MADTLPLPPRVLELERAESLDPTGMAQAALTRAFLADRLIQVEADMAALRREADAALQPGGESPRASDGHDTYPIGACKPIRDYALNRLWNPRPEDRGRAGFEAIAAFRAAGGIVKGLWGIQKGKYFQNAIQVGDLWFDLANDTVDPERPTVEILPLDQAEFEEILSFDQYARVAEPYWGVEIHPNLYFPELTAAFPVLVHEPGQLIRIPAPATLVPRNVRLGFQPALDFFAHSPFATRRLPDAVLARLGQRARERGGLFGGVDNEAVSFHPGGTIKDAEDWIGSEQIARAISSTESYFNKFAAQLSRRRIPIDLKAP
jgi:hypothetical protein